MSSTYYGRLTADECCLFVCDMQEKFQKSILYFDEIAVNISRLVEGSKLLDIPIVVTEQVPEKLGNTVWSIGTHSHGIKPYAKTQFSMATSDVMGYLKDHSKVKTILLTGVETHVCVINTAIDLLEKGYNVHVIVDGSSSRVQKDRYFALDRLRQMGVFLNTTESVLLSLVGDAAHPQFKAVQKLIIEPGPDAGLNMLTQSKL